MVGFLLLPLDYLVVNRILVPSRNCIIKDFSLFWAAILFSLDWFCGVFCIIEAYINLETGSKVCMSMALNDFRPLYLAYTVHHFIVI